MILVQCSCGWTVAGGPGLIHPHLVDVKVCENIAEMVQHWRDGHNVQARPHARDAIRRAAKALKRLQQQRQAYDDIMQRPPRRSERGRWADRTYDPFTDDWS